MYLEGEPGVAGVRNPLVGVPLREGSVIYMLNRICQPWTVLVSRKKIYVWQAIHFDQAFECEYSKVCKDMTKSQ
jgi:hypothetical protein